MTKNPGKPASRKRPRVAAISAEDFVAPSEVTVLMERENSAVASAWKEYLCLTPIGRGRWRLFTGLLDPEGGAKDFQALPDGGPEFIWADLSPARRYCREMAWAKAAGFKGAWAQLELAVLPEVRIVMREKGGPVVKLNDAALGMGPDDLVSFLKDASMLAEEEAASVEQRALENPPEEE
jgi:hypothetical protein